MAQEILAGAANAAAYRQYHRDWVAPFEDIGRIITPARSTWMRAAFIIARLVETGDMSRGDFGRGFLNDCLIAASAREHGFVVVTSNVHDFARIRRVETRFRYEPPWPER